MLTANHILALFIISLSGCWVLVASSTTSSSTATTRRATTTHPTITALPDGIASCKEDADIHDCIRNTFNKLLKSSKNGIAEISIPPIDPLVQEKLKIEFSNDIIHGKALARHVHIYGFSDSVIEQTQFQRNATKFTLKMHLKCPKITINAEYKAQIQWNTSKLKSRGVFNITMTDIDLHSDHYAELYKRDGQTFVKVTKVDGDPTLGGMHISATGLVPEPALNDALLQVLNENWRSVSQSVLPAIHSTMEPVIIRYSNEIFARIPFNLILKDI